MRREQVESTVIRSVGYDVATAVLEIEFTSGDLYRYYAVPPSAHRGLLAADSAGRFFAQRIRPVYPTEQIR
ncbi:KTSC domain-containing protein [Microbacterium sp. BK668]|uniref:KTSC domain-containing protein n=1 Tax=Microbacterium sp. BK668 TaxID=2512118 RepID=UPI00105FFE50|nr:KTSC domain-containing protein [Microbacterium sp. BK668]TDN92908.1 KTSC domain-containing protein [Microbacterium sp. BK668]